MRSYLLFITIFTLGIISGNSVKAQKSARKIEVDDYPVPNRKFTGHHQERKSGPVLSVDQAWFTNDSLQETLVFALETDDFRYNIFHFKNHDIPKQLINRMELIVESRYPANNQLKQKYFKGLLKSCIPLAARYFKTNKGFRLGDPKEKAIKAYGRPHKVSTSDGIEMCEWTFIGDNGTETETETARKAKKTLARDSFGYQVTMFFRTGQLIGMILHNDVP